jgi:hypothetical protein
MLNWGYAWAHFQGSSPQDTEVAGNVGVAPLPAFEGFDSATCIGGWQWAINPFSDNKDAAWRLLEFLASPDVQRVLAVQASNIPARQSLYQDPEVLEAAPALRRLLRRHRQRPLAPRHALLQRRLRGDPLPDERLLRPPVDATRRSRRCSAASKRRSTSDRPNRRGCSGRRPPRELGRRARDPILRSGKVSPWPSPHPPARTASPASGAGCARATSPRRSSASSSSSPPPSSWRWSCSGRSSRCSGSRSTSSASTSPRAAGPFIGLEHYGRMLWGTDMTWDLQPPARLAPARPSRRRRALVGRRARRRWSAGATAIVWTRRSPLLVAGLWMGYHPGEDGPLERRALLERLLHHAAHDVVASVDRRLRRRPAAGAAGERRVALALAGAHRPPHPVGDAARAGGGHVRLALQLRRTASSTTCWVASASRGRCGWRAPTPPSWAANHHDRLGDLGVRRAHPARRPAVDRRQASTRPRWSTGRAPGSASGHHAAAAAPVDRGGAHLPHAHGDPDLRHPLRHDPRRTRAASLETLGIYVSNTTNSLNLGYAAALAVALFAMSLAITVVYLRWIYTDD